TTGAGMPGERVARRDSLAALRAGGLFVAGFSVVFVLLGLSATAIGSLLVSQQVPVTRLAGAAVVAMALVMFATTLPVRWLGIRDVRFHPALAGYGVWAAPVAGAAFAFGWTPCIGPVLGSVLAVAADQHRVAQGAALLASYAAGLAVPFLVSAIAFARSLVAFGWVRRHSTLLTRAAAVVLAGYGVLLALDELSWVTVQVQRGMTLLGLDRLVGLG
ncbi:MAG TPA: cytochrome c biogenesis CcdA family protein, partial [Jatrophihabitans sp.]|nr:cytochrome c biogenesis CcdA family protein [Jatrophihabitans sp.]